MRFRPLASGFAVSVHLAILVACGGGTEGAATSDSFADQYCALFSPCCEQAKRPTDGATCKAFVSAGASGKTYDAAKGTECLEKARAAAAKPDFCSFVDMPDCSGVYVAAGGGAAPGASCKDDSDCATSPEGKVDCASTFSSGSESRVCQLQIAGKEGAGPCIGTKDGNVTSFSSSGSGGPPPSRGFICNVADGVRCDGKTTKCVRIGDVGATCDGTTNACVKTAYCDATQKCAARLPEGAACGVSGVSSNACLATAYCDSTAKKCTPALADGTACTKSEQCRSDRCLNGKCESTSASSSFALAFLCGGS